MPSGATTCGTATHSFSHLPRVSAGSGAQRRWRERVSRAESCGGAVVGWTSRTHSPFSLLAVVEHRRKRRTAEKHLSFLAIVDLIAASMDCSIARVDKERQKHVGVPKMLLSTMLCGGRRLRQADVRCMPEENWHAASHILVNVGDAICTIPVLLCKL